jgi:hypothetical protein
MADFKPQIKHGKEAHISAHWISAPLGPITHNQLPGLVKGTTVNGALPLPRKNLIKGLTNP